MKNKVNNNNNNKKNEMKKQIQDCTKCMSNDANVYMKENKSEIQWTEKVSNNMNINNEEDFSVDSEESHERNKIEKILESLSKA